MAWLLQVDLRPSNRATMCQKSLTLFAFTGDLARAPNSAGAVGRRKPACYLS